MGRRPRCADPAGRRPRRLLDLHADHLQSGAGSVLQPHPLQLQSRLPIGSRLRDPAAALPAARRQRPADRLHGEGLPQLPPGAAGFLGAALSVLAGAIGSRFRRHVPRGTQRDRRRTELHPGSRRHRIQPAHRHTAPFGRYAMRGWSITNPARPVSAKTVLQFDVDAAAGPTIKHGLAVIAPCSRRHPDHLRNRPGTRDTTPEPPASSLWNRAARIQPYSVRRQRTRACRSARPR